MTTEAQTPAVRIQQQESFSEVTERDWLRWIGLAMAVIGIGVGAYLSYTKLSDTDVICTSSGSIDCAGVQDSVYSEIAGVPIALLGLGAYVTIFGLLLLEDRLTFLMEYGRSILFSMTLFGLAYSGYLTYIEGVVLEKWCLWCVASALLMVGLFGVAAVRVWRDLTDEVEDAEDYE